MSREDAAIAIRFPSTQWSLVGRAGQMTGERRREALATVLHRYMPALRAHLVLGRRIPPDRADDLIQGFIADKMIEQNLLSTAEQNRGPLSLLPPWRAESLRRWTISPSDRAQVLPTRARAGHRGP